MNELDVDQLMNAIRESAVKRHPSLDAYQPIPFGSLPQVKTTNHQPRLTLSPEFTVRSDNAYHVNDLLQYHDRDFVKNAYRAILKREPDEAGFHHNLKLLQSGAFNKIDVLASLRYSDEGKLNGVSVTGLRLPATIRSLERIPIFGYLLQVLIAFVRLPAMIRSQRQFQGYIVSQQLAIADHVNDAQRTAANDLQARTAALSNQLHSLEATVMARFLAEQEKLQQAEARLLLLTDRLSDVSQTLSRALSETRHELDEQMRDLAIDVSTLGHNVSTLGHNVSTLGRNVSTLGRNLVTEENRTIDELREWDNFYAAFEEQFRGSADEVEERLRFYLPFLKQLNAESNILDLGSGRGDWLELLAKEGYKSRGVEVNEVLAERSRQKGFAVDNTEMMVYLGQQPDNSLDLVTVFHLIEHFNVGKLIRLLDEIKRTLKPGGLLIIETPSPENLVVGACNFYADPTHYKPIYPKTLIFLLDNKGFADLKLEYLHSVDQSPFKGEADGFEQLNMWFYGPRDFAVIARKAQ